jgi:hypothetical protein
MIKRNLPALTVTLLLSAIGMHAQGQSANAIEHRKVDFIVHSDRNDVSPPLRDMTIIAPSTVRKGRPVREHRIPIEELAELDEDPLIARMTGRGAKSGAADVNAATAALALTSNTGMDGAGNGAYSMTVNSAPPDTTGAVGATQFVQWVNTAFVVFDKASKA